MRFDRRYSSHAAEPGVSDQTALQSAPGKQTLALASSLAASTPIARAPDTTSSSTEPERATDALVALQLAEPSPSAQLPGGLRQQFESSLGADLGGVRLHTGPESERAASSLSAAAFTTGQDIHFAQDQYQPGTPEGQHLLAHEVAHTVQQAQGGSGVQRMASGDDLQVSEPADSHELEADRAAAAMLSGRPATVSPAAGLSRQLIQRNPPSATSHAQPEPLAAHGQVESHAHESESESHRLRPHYTFQTEFPERPVALGRFFTLKIGGNFTQDVQSVEAPGRAPSAPETEHSVGLQSSEHGPGIGAGMQGHFRNEVISRFGHPTFHDTIEVGANEESGAHGVAGLSLQWPELRSSPEGHAGFSVQPTLGINMFGREKHFVLLHPYVDVAISAYLPDLMVEGQLYRARVIGSVRITLEPRWEAIGPYLLSRFGIRIAQYATVTTAATVAGSGAVAGGGAAAVPGATAAVAGTETVVAGGAAAAAEMTAIAALPIVIAGALAAMVLNAFRVGDEIADKSHYAARWVYGYCTGFTDYICHRPASLSDAYPGVQNGAHTAWSRLLDLIHAGSLPNPLPPAFFQAMAQRPIWYEVYHSIAPTVVRQTTAALGGGTLAHGVVQAAMDTVGDGRNPDARNYAADFGHR